MCEYYYLKTGETVQEGDEYDACADGWRDDSKWQQVKKDAIGRKVSNPIYPSHARFRRASKVVDEGYAWVCELGEVTDSSSIATNWANKGHTVKALTQSQYRKYLDAIAVVAWKFFKS